jgi:hypothetical protein
LCSAGVGELLIGVELAVHLVVGVAVVNDYQRVGGVGGIPVLACYRSRRVCKIIGGAYGVIIIIAEHPAEMMLRIAFEAAAPVIVIMCSLQKTKCTLLIGYF